MEDKIAELKAKKADLQRTREKVLKMGRSPRLFDRMISGVDRALNQIRRELEHGEEATA